MVKLKVTVRVIPEDIYLANIEASPIPSTHVRGEKRFYVVVREPEAWYIGTLALEVQRRYESLYKHDLGKIKYLKDNASDCDLDPEQNVAEALVDEGRALKDPSDQNITIKVIQEQGRHVRQGSVVPDLSQVHYQLPQRPARPPVPTFQDIESTLGKRKAVHDVQRRSSERKRSRLDEIEDEQPLASIEHSQIRELAPTSQSQSSSPDRTRKAQSRVPPSPKWSFDRIGAPTIIQESSQPVQIQSVDSSPRSRLKPNGLGNATTQTTARERTPNTTSQSLNGHNANGMQTMSPLAAASSASKKFLKPRKDIFAEPESDIDDSQMSPASRDTSKITPRLVPSSRLSGRQAYNQKESNSSPIRYPLKKTNASITRKDSEMDEDEPTKSYLGNNEDPTTTQAIEDVEVEEIDSPTSKDTGRSTSREKSGSVDSHESVKEQAQNNKTQLFGNNLDLKSATPPSVDDSNSSKRDANETAIHKGVEAVQSQETLSMKSPQAADAEDDENDEDSDSEASSTHSSAAESGEQVTDVDRSINLKHTRASTSDPEQQNDREIVPVVDVPMTGHDIESTIRSVASGLSTPVLDSPSEQLIHALDESTRKPVEATSIQIETAGQGNIGATTKAALNATTKKMSKKSVTTDDATDHRSAVSEPVSKPTVKRVKEPPAIGVKKGAKQQESKEDDPTLLETRGVNGVLPKVNQATREVSADSQMTSSSKTVLPPGMTQEQYDKVVREFTAKPPQSSAQTKRKATPLLRQTPSAELAAGKQTSSPAYVKSSKSNTNQSKSTVDIRSTSAKDQSEDSASSEDDSVASIVAEAASLAKGPSLVPSNRLTSDKSKASSTKTPSEASSNTSTLKKTTSKLPSIPAEGSTRSTNQTQSSPALSTARMAVPASSSRANPKEALSSTLKPMLPPSTSSIRYSPAVAATPTPLPRFKPHANITKPNLPVAPKPSLSTVTTQTTTKPTTARPTVLPTFSSARNLSELRAIVSSANNSSAGSPAPSGNRFSFTKKDLLNNDSDSDSDSSDGDDSSSASAVAAPPKSSQKSTSTPIGVKVSSSIPSASALGSRPDPTIRDNSPDDSDASDDS